MRKRKNHVAKVLKHQTVKTGGVMKKKEKEPITSNDTSIAKFAGSIANDVFEPSSLFNDLLNNITPETPGGDDLTALCTAIQSDYPDLLSVGTRRAKPATLRYIWRRYMRKRGSTSGWQWAVGYAKGGSHEE